MERFNPRKAREGLSESYEDLKLTVEGMDDIYECCSRKQQQTIQEARIKTMGWMRAIREQCHIIGSRHESSEYEKRKALERGTKAVVEAKEYIHTILPLKIPPFSPGGEESELSVVKQHIERCSNGLSSEELKESEEDFRNKCNASENSMLTPEQFHTQCSSDLQQAKEVDMHEAPHRDMGSITPLSELQKLTENPTDENNRMGSKEYIDAALYPLESLEEEDPFSQAHHYS